jgi:hypothetical protein
LNTTVVDSESSDGRAAACVQREDIAVYTSREKQYFAAI